MSILTANVSLIFLLNFFLDSCVFNTAHLSCRVSIIAMLIIIIIYHHNYHHHNFVVNQVFGEVIVSPWSWQESAFLLKKKENPEAQHNANDIDVVTGHGHNRVDMKSSSLWQQIPVSKAVLFL